MSELFQILLLAFIEIFAENTIFSKGFGSSTMIISAKNKKYLIGFSICITYFTTLTSVILFFFQNIFQEKGIDNLYFPIICVIIIGVVYVLTLLLLWKFLNNIFIKVKKFVHLSAFNCAVFGTLLSQSLETKPFIEYLIFGLCTGIGFFIAAYLLSIVYEKLNSENVPKSFRGYPIILVYIGIMSMAFYGFVQ